jgi:hypothetical protein
MHLLLGDADRSRPALLRITGSTLRVADFTVPPPMILAAMDW